MQDDAENIRRTGLFGAAEAIITFWALAGGIVVLGVVAINVWAVLSGFALFSSLDIAFAGDFELTQMGIAIAVFMFLPYCQLTGANVTADIFTARASPFWLSLFTLLASTVALVFAALLVYTTYGGLVDQRSYNYMTAILQIPTWYAYVAAIASLVLLVIAALVTFLETLADVTGPKE